MSAKFKIIFLSIEVMTQGRFGNGRGVEFTEAYKLHYWRPGMTDFIEYHDTIGRSVSATAQMSVAQVSGRHRTMYQKLILKGCKMADLRELKIWCVHLTNILGWMSYLPNKLPTGAHHYAFWAP